MQNFSHTISNKTSKVLNVCRDFYRMSGIENLVFDQQAPMNHRTNSVGHLPYYCKFSDNRKLYKYHYPLRDTNDSTNRNELDEFCGQKTQEYPNLQIRTLELILLFTLNSSVKIRLSLILSLNLKMQKSTKRQWLAEIGRNWKIRMVLNYVLLHGLET